MAREVTSKDAILAWLNEQYGQDTLECIEQLAVTDEFSFERRVCRNTGTHFDQLAVEGAPIVHSFIVSANDAAAVARLRERGSMCSKLQLYRRDFKEAEARDAIRSELSAECFAAVGKQRVMRMSWAEVRQARRHHVTPDFAFLDRLIESFCG